MIPYEKMLRAFELSERMVHFNPSLPLFKGGVYRIRNIVTDEYYIGSTVNLRGRRSNHAHRLVYNYHTRLLQTAFNTYGPESLAFEVVLLCEPEWLSEYEWALIDKLQPAYNWHK